MRRRLAPALALATLALGALSGCGGTPVAQTVTVTTTVPATTTTVTTAALPGTGKPLVIVGDKNTPEEFVLGELYYQALRAQGFNATLNRNIGPVSVTMHALAQGTLSMYPEYIDTWDSQVAGAPGPFISEADALAAGRHWARAHGYELLAATPFSDTQALAVDFNYAVQHGLSTIADLRKVQSSLTLGGPLPFQTSPSGLPALTRAYGFTPAAFKPLIIGAQYQALDQGTVQAAEVDTTDGQIITGNYSLLADPERVFGFGNVVPVVPATVVAAEGPVFVRTINRVSALLTLPVIRQLNAAVAEAGLDPGAVAKQFLQAHGIIPPTQG
jgi:osmoprotectant transport system substrate-binding protein